MTGLRIAALLRAGGGLSPPGIRTERVSGGSTAPSKNRRQAVVAERIAEMGDDA